MPSNRIASVVHIKFYTQEVNEDRDVGYPVFGDYLYTALLACIVAIAIHKKNTHNR